MLAPLHPALYRRFAAGLLAVALVISGWALTRYWNESLRDGHEGRQQHTALTAYYFKQDGLKLAYETPLLGPPWSIPMEFPLYQAIVAKLSAATGYPLEQTGRLVSVFFFYAALPALWLLLRRRVPAPPDALLALAFVLVCPLYLFYSRTFMIESTALCLSLWFLVALDRCLARPLGWALPAAWLLGALAAATKITTFVAAGSGAAILILEQVLARRRAGVSRNRAALLTGGAACLALVVPLVAAVLWVRFSDDQKNANPFGIMITSHGLREFIWGTLAQRLSGEWWEKIITNHLTIIAALPGLAVLAVGPWLVERRYRWAVGACLLCYVVGHLFFANLYYVHDYYPYASAFYLLVAIGLVVAGLLRKPGFPGVAAVLLALGVFAGELYAFRTSYYNFYRRPNPAEPVETEIIRAITPPEDVIAVFGFDWNPVWPYYSQRRAIVPPLAFFENFAALDASLKNLGPRRLAVMGLARANRDDSRFTGALVAQLQLCAQPIARTELMDIYVRKDLAAAAIRALAKHHWNAEINLSPDPGVIVLEEAHDLAAQPWLGTMASFSPRPFQSKGMYPVNPLDDLADTAGRALLTQAPTEIHFQPPPGSRTIAAIGGMLPSAYTPPNNTPGVLISVFEEMPDGTRRPLFERLLRPVTEPGDRGDILIDYTQEQPFTGMIVFAHYPGPSGNVSFCWSYWKRIVIR
jgi:hypothetical protein